MGPRPFGGPGQGGPGQGYGELKHGLHTTKHLLTMQSVSMEAGCDIAAKTAGRISWVCQARNS